MNMVETQDDILNDLRELGDSMSQFSYLIECAKECLGAAGQVRKPEYLVRDCAVNTWVHAEVRDGCVRLEGDSESFIVRGAIALIEELYNERSIQEVSAFRCMLLDEGVFTRHFSSQQRTGLAKIIASIQECAINSRVLTE